MPNEDGATPGDAVNNPFGDGSGSMASKYSGNNFGTNPAGQSPKPPVNNYIANPSGAGGPVPGPTGTGEDPDINQGDRAPGPATAAQVATPAGEQISRRDIGTVAGQAVHKPFRTTGG